MVVEGVHLDVRPRRLPLGRRAPPVARREHGRGRAHRIEQGRGEERGRESPAPEEDAVEVGEGLEHPVDPIAEDREIADDLVVGRALGLGDRTAEVVHEGDVRHRADHPMIERSGGDRERPALGSAGDEDLRSIHLRQRGCGLNRVVGVDVDPAVVVIAGVLDAARHEALIPVAGAPRIRGRSPIAPRAALTARVHEEMGESGARPVEVVHRKAASSAVALVLDDGRQGALGRHGQREPSADRIRTETGEDEIQDPQSLKRRLNLIDAH